ncbi:MAG: FecR domain-containing protein [Armatimonadetes bacterium]|nr:FecR domain-containing protein [Armatimonadota bacterium]
MNKKFILSSILVLFICIFSFVLAQEMKAQALIIGIYGRLEVNRSGEKLLGKIRMPLFNGDIIKTNASSYAVILLKDKTEIKIKENSRLEIKFEPKTKKKFLLIYLGEIWAKVTFQKNNFVIMSPAGAAAIEGTELDFKVSDNSESTLTVAKGKVKFSNKIGAVYLGENTQSKIASLGITPSSPSQINAELVTAWHKTILKYIEAIDKFSEIYQLIEADSLKRSGAVSKDLMDQLRWAEEEIKIIVPDEEFLIGHRALVSALDYFKKSLIFTDAGEKADFKELAQSKFAVFQAEFNVYQRKYQKFIQEFLK